MTPDSLLAAADRCVKCGLCLPHCPTYGVFRDEAESPRGRIALIQGMLEGQLEASPELLRHLDRCLLCRNCERACPSLVEYGALMDGVRADLPRRQPAWLLRVITDPRRLALLVRLGAAVRHARLAPLLPARWRRMTDWAARASTAADKRVPADDATTPRGRVALFPGCVSSVMDRRLVDAAVRLLDRLGFRVVLPEEPLCCGALHLHAGRAAEAERLLERSRRVLGALGVDAVLTVASGCGAELLEHGCLGTPVADLGAFLADADWPESLLATMPECTVALHQPCTLRNVMRQEGGVAALLRRFGSVRTIGLDSGCCGAAGMHLVEYPELAATLAAPLIDAARANGVDAVLTSNTGCALHLDSEARRAGLPLAVAHPVEFIATRLGI